jgi:hypothetical protein
MSLTKVDIANRALQKIGASRITAFTDDTKAASEVNACYDRLREAELRRNPWRAAIRRVALRPYGTFNATKLLTFATWSNIVTYAANEIVTGSDGNVYYSNAASNLAHDPSSTTGYWTSYFGPLTAQEYVTDWGAGFTYALGDHAIGSDDNVYVSLVAGNINHNPVSTVGVDWQIASTADSDDLTAEDANTYYAGELVFIGATTYVSLESNNQDVPPSSKWHTLVNLPALAVPTFIYPIGSGPATDTNTKNVFRLPQNWLCEAPQDPRSPAWPRDWVYESSYIVSQEPGPIVYRFVADVIDVTAFDPLFIEGFACRIAFELCETLTQSITKMGAIGKEYQQFMGDARLRNAIENGPEIPEEDDWLVVKVSGATSPYQFA